MKESEEWLEVGQGLPKDGDYEVKVVNKGEEVVTKRRLIEGKWFGGCRPFTDGEEVTHYKTIVAATSERSPLPGKVIFTLH